MTATEEGMSLCFGNWLKTEFKVFVKFTFSLDNALRAIVFKVKGAMDALNLSVVTLSALSAEQGTYILGDVHTYSKLPRVKEDTLLDGSDIFLTLLDIQEIGE